MTGVKFTDRFSEHTEKWLKKTMTFTGILGHKTVSVDLKPIAYLVKMYPPVAKFFESALLSAFDFPVNKKENNGGREKIWIRQSESVDAGRNHFSLHLNPIISNLQNALEFIGMRY